MFRLRPPRNANIVRPDESDSSWSTQNSRTIAGFQASPPLSSLEQNNPTPLFSNLASVHSILEPKQRNRIHSRSPNDAITYPKSHLQFPLRPTYTHTLQTKNHRLKTEQNATLTPKVNQTILEKKRYSLRRVLAATNRIRMRPSKTSNYTPKNVQSTPKTRLLLRRLPNADHKTRRKVRVLHEERRDRRVGEERARDAAEEEGATEEGQRATG